MQGIRSSMTADECHGRASECAANAAEAHSETLALEFLKLAAQWRAMARREIFLGSVDALFDPPLGPTAPALPAG